MTKSRPILFCGGGSLGHIVPSIAIAQALKKLDPQAQVVFICQKRAEDIAFIKHAGFTYRTIIAGKFPRGFSIRWITFPVLSICALVQSIIILMKLRPQLIFSKGGFVSLPVCLVGWLMRLPIVLHESDAVMGMSNGLVARLATTVCVGFAHPDGLRKKKNTIITGNPVRHMIEGGSKDAGKRLTGFSGRKPVILITGGSQGAKTINDAVDAQFDALLSAGDIIHLTGKGKRIDRTHAHYWARETVHDELPHLYALADIVITRAGAGTLSELAAAQKAALVIPIVGLANNHQVENAKRLLKAHAIRLLWQDAVYSLANIVSALVAHPHELRRLGKSLHAYFPPHADTTIANIILDACKKTR
ncbi:MAG: UDP-N-acetylglucosamine--N-acetylmuramyl-(pentapeptide) pyrophosphoryl-undecaprenol N-acetylglucosamine transferase [Candidatus Peribacteraceae bacterium]|nr:UDP-N-acetylglucosamine--N-acetylmuramyl-(pentapeptide) pyrophosphoryl-undecaprenol N-acetylglucosamine transferase [Candidatus Peribacteraceae bacterium]